MAKLAAVRGRLPKMTLVGALALLAPIAVRAPGVLGTIAGFGPAVAAARAHAASTSPVPQRFIGMVLDGPVYPDSDNHIDLAHQLDLMVASGVASIRVVADWGKMQPYRSWNRVPSSDRSRFIDVGGVPTDFSGLDQIVGLAAQRGMTVLPEILNAPSWDAIHRTIAVALPKSDGPYANFAKALVERYGPHGTFWQSTSPSVPIRMWQIWNEPNIVSFWPIQPFQPTYLALLRAAHNAIKSVDPGAKIVLAGMPNRSWLQLRKIYSHRGARGLFDVVALHPYTKDPEGVITIMAKARRVMNAAGDRGKPIIADEISWPSSVGKTSGYDFSTTASGQARNIAAVLPLLARDRASLGLLSFYYYTWAGVQTPGGWAWGYAGLFRYSAGRFIAKPALSAFRHGALALEHCQRKGNLATICLQYG